MNSTTRLLQLAKLQIRQGDVREARDLLAEVLHLHKSDGPWVEAARMYLQCCQELEEISLVKPLIDQAFEFLRSGPSESLQAQTEILVASWLLAQGKEEECEGYIQSAITKATHSRDLPTLASALLIQIITHTLDPASYGPALLQLDKLDVILGETDQPEVALSAKLFRGYIYTQKNQHDKALEILWQAYEQAKAHGLNLFTVSILAQLARVHRDQKQDDLYRTFAKLAIKGLDKDKLPRLYKMISAVCPKELEGLEPLHDFQVDETSRLVREKTKGVIDFKNQHILYDLALLFIKNPGRRYSKEDLLQIIWNQIYDPDMHDNLIYVSIKRLRTLLEPDLESPRYILRDRKGYYFNPQSVVQFHRLEEVSL